MTAGRTCVERCGCGTEANESRIKPSKQAGPEIGVNVWGGVEAAILSRQSCLQVCALYCRIGLHQVFEEQVRSRL
jgi:hypothetical protein